MTTWGNICRICSSPADYEIFAKIPTYLHASCNEFLNWQKPINVLLEETTGLKVTPDDGLPRCICALCISYLKHAVSFREQTINNALSLKAVSMYRQAHQGMPKTHDNKSKLGQEDKESLLITAQDLNFTTEHQINTSNLLLNNAHQEQNKVNKQLLSYGSNTAASIPQNIEQQLRYLNSIFEKDSNAGLRENRKQETGIMVNHAEHYPEEDFQTATSSDENEENNGRKHNMFSYREKNFEEDDIMDMDELREAITINIPESCKERKCRACFRRFMFEESYSEHMDTCIEYKFLTYIEEVNRLLDIRRNKAISPHEFIRRMIFCLRKTCEWLKANCSDILLPDILQNGESKVLKKRLESECKSSGSSGEVKTKTGPITGEKAMSDFVKEMRLLLTPKAVQSRTNTPITMSNNILYEIERSQSRNSQQLSLKKPIAVLATSTNPANDSNKPAIERRDGDDNDTQVDRLTFLEKLQRAACQTPPTLKTESNATTGLRTPLIGVRQDLLPVETPPAKEILWSTICPSPSQNTKPTRAASINFSARCNPCNLAFETLAALEVHNAMHHNNLTQQRAETDEVPIDAAAAEAERRRIIALFEEEDDAEII